MKKNTALLGDLSLLLVAIIWGFSFVVCKNALSSITPFYLMTVRFTFAAFVLSILFFNKLRKIKFTDFKKGLTIGIFLYLGFAAQTVGLEYTTAGKNAFLTGLNVVIVPFLSWALTKKSLDKKAILSAIFSVIGIALLTLDGSSFLINYGDFLTILCAIFFAGHIVSIGFFSSSSSPIILTIVQFYIAAIFSGVSAVFLETPPSLNNSNLVLSLIYISLVATLVAFLVQNVAQKYTSSSHAAILLCTESVFGALFSCFLLKEAFSYRMIIGCIIIFIAILNAETDIFSISKLKS